tara:strand:- start:1056 stop:1313 length:258 start_codon:yes stop_codon:yes gene_type:complete
METTENTLDLKEVSTEDLRQELELRGYQMDNLWQSADVMDIYDCDSEVAMKILIKALNNNATMEQIWLSIESEAEHKGLINSKLK